MKIPSLLLLLFCFHSLNGDESIEAEEDECVPHVTLVSPTGLEIPLSGDPLPETGRICEVSINDSGFSIIGGQGNGNSAYAALVSPTGVVKDLTGDPLPSDGAVRAVSINTSGVSIIGGEGGSVGAYAALISPSGKVMNITGGEAPPPETNGVISSVAINNEGFSIIGGKNRSNFHAYAALVTPAGSTIALTGPAPPPTFGQINDVAINASGLSIIGGQGDSNSAYGALVSPTGITTMITGDAPLPVQGSLLSVSINDAGSSIIGGIDSTNSGAYAALVSPTGVTTAITGDPLPASGYIQSVSINNAGIAVIGGQDNVAGAYTALISPTGIATILTGSLNSSTDIETILMSSPNSSTDVETTSMPSLIAFSSNHNINAVSVNGVTTPGGASILLDAMVPNSFGPGSSFANALFALSSQVLPNHMADQKRGWNQQQRETAEVGLLVDASNSLIVMQRDRKELKNSQKNSALHHKEPTYSLWGSLFGEYVNQKKDNTTPALQDWLGGALLAFDYLGIRDMTLGGGIAYAYNYVDLAGGLGHAQVNQEFASLYGSWSKKHLYITAALWGGFYQINNVRHSIAFITSTSHVNGWLLSPHFEIGAPFFAKSDWFLIVPFTMVDWANNWQGHIQEQGASGFNLLINSQYTSLLRTEVGFRFYEDIRYEWGTLIFQEKGSYVNKAPFHTGPSSASFVGSISSFTIETFSDQMQNLGVVQFNVEFIPWQIKYPYGSINYQGEFGSTFQSHLISFEIGLDF